MSRVKPSYAITLCCFILLLGTMFTVNSHEAYAHESSLQLSSALLSIEDLPPQPPPPEDVPQMPGRLEGTGTHFQLNNSEYVNVRVDSSEPIHLILESVPEMVTVHIEPTTTAASATVTLGGFSPSTTYHKYEDDYHNHVAFTTDAGGTYTYTQDLSQGHLVFVQPRTSTIYLSSSGWSNPAVGTWNPTTKTGTLTADVTETIQINSNSITLDGNGHTITGSNTGYGVYLPSRTGVVVKNLKVTKFTHGIYLDNSNGNTLTGNSMTWNSGRGIYLYRSSTNSLSDNIASSNGLYGIYIELYSNGNTLTRNTVSCNYYGMVLASYAGGNILTGNTISGSSQWNFWFSGGQDSDYASTSIDTSNKVDGKPIYYVKDAVDRTYDGSTNAGTFYCVFCRNVRITGLTLTKNYYGLLLYKTRDSTIENNIVSGNGAGMLLLYSDNNLLTGNTANSNWDFGIVLSHSSANSLVSNTMNSNVNHGLSVQQNSNSNIVTGDTVSNNNNGIWILESIGNTVTSNTANSNNYSGLFGQHLDSSTVTGNTFYRNRYGIRLQYSDGNTFTKNVVDSNTEYGIHIQYSNTNSIYNNNFLNNPTQAYSGGANVFYQSKPVGGNYWSNYDAPSERCNDADSDGFCDLPYVFSGGHDALPWTRMSGWLDTTPPTTTDNAPATWQKLDFVVTLTCTDNAGGSGCKETKYRVDAGAWQTGTSVSITAEGHHLIEYYSIDKMGNQENVKLAHVKLDKSAPIVTSSGDQVVEATSPAGAVVSYPAAAATDNFGVTSGPTCLPASGSVFPLGTTVVACTAGDAAGNVGSASFNVIVQDTMGPAVTVPVPDMVVEATGPGGAVVGFTVTASDLVDGSVAVTCTPGSGSDFAVGETTVNCEATDAHGNKATSSFKVTVVDTTAPMFGALPSPVAEAASASGATVSFSELVTATDAVSTPTIVCTPASGSTFPIATTPVSCTAADSAGNSASASFTVTVQDTTAPEATIASAVDGDGALVANDGSTLSTSIMFTFAGTDAVGVAGFECRLDGSGFTPCNSPMVNSSLAPGFHTFEVRAIDEAGNTDTSEFAWTILTPAQAVGNLIETISDLNLPPADETSLSAPLKNAADLLNDNNPNNDNAVVGKLTAFMNQVNAKEKSGRLTAEQAAELRELAQAILTRLGFS